MQQQAGRLRSQKISERHSANFLPSFVIQIAVVERMNSFRAELFEARVNFFAGGAKIFVIGVASARTE